MSTSSFAIVGSASLLGKELREVFEALPKAVNLRLLGAGDEAGPAIAGDTDEALVVGPLDEASLSDVTVALLAGGVASSQRAWDLMVLRKKRPFVVDLSGALAGVPQAQLRAPLVEAPGFKVKKSSVQVIAHPATVALSVLLRRFQGELTAKSVSSHVFLPVSEHGTPGIDELHQQAVHLLGFQSLKKDLFDEQLAFNVVPAWGSEATAGSLRSAEDTIREELAQLLPKTGLPPVSVRCLQAGVFHCLSASLRVEFAGPVSAETLSRDLRGDLIDFWTQEQGVPSHLSAVGESGIVVGDVRPDPSVPNAYWIWMVADNLRMRAANAIATARIWLS
jgi:aspartate-semialdehyde dehydrogenase